MDFDDMMEFAETHSNITEGTSLLETLDAADLTESIALAQGDGAVDGAFYLLYYGLSESGLIKNLDVPFHHDGEEETSLMTSTSILKILMYHCFLIGAESMKRHKDLQRLWGLPESEDPHKEVKENGK